MDQARFGAVLFLSDKAPDARSTADIEWRRIEPLKSRADYSRFMLHNLVDHIVTPHALCVQWDGFVLNGRAWENAFLEYDYIGAVWPQFGDGRTVGNGGFSLRSRRLLEACRELPLEALQAEDVIIARTFRSRLERQGIRFAPEDVARRFSYERTSPNGKEFGFHGAFNLVRHQSRDDVLHTFGELESGLLTHREHREILRWAIVNGRYRLARILLRRIANRLLGKVAWRHS